MANAAKIQQFPVNKNAANKSVTLNDVRIEMDAEGTVIVFTDRMVEVRSPAGNGGVVEAFTGGPAIGARMPDGTIYAGVTADGARIFAMPEDLEGTMTSNNAQRAIEALNAQNAFGHNDWQIPSIDAIKVMGKNTGKGALAGTFSETTVLRDTAGFPIYPHWYWTSTHNPLFPSLVYATRLTDGEKVWFTKDDSRMSCRPVRVVAA